MISMGPHFTGLTSEKAKEILDKEGLNIIPEAKNVFLKKIISSFFSVISLMLLGASLLSFYTDKVFDGFFIIFLLILNSSVTFWQERKADNAIKKLNKSISSFVEVLRDNEWKKLDSTKIVRGDTIRVSLGGVIPGDGRILEAKNLSINQSVLTGESLPLSKKEGDTVYSGSFVSTGLVVLEVTATGPNTYFGKTISSVDKVRKKSLLEQDIIRISQFLSAMSIVAIVILTAVFLSLKVSFVDTLTLSLTLLIAGIPISLPTVMTLIIELGVIELAKKKVIVRRLSSLEDLSNVNFLLTDKTGTLTKNLISINQVVSYSDFSANEVILYSYLSSVNDAQSTINQAIIRKKEELKLDSSSYEINDFIPVDLERKRASVTATYKGEKLDITVGAPQEIEKLCKLSDELKAKLENDVEDFARRGFRAVAVAVGKKEKNMELAGLLSLSDELREEAGDVISFLKQNGISTSMVTGDNKAITSEIVRKLGIEGDVLTKEDLEKMGWENVAKDTFLKTGAFSEIMPEDKLLLVKYAKKYFVVASNGDGINDLPALKEANVGIAVKNAVDALKATGDIVLLSSGISVIKDAIIEARKIFERLYVYSVYRLSESQRLIITVLVLGLIYKIYPLTPLQLILLALLNDLPIIALAFDRVKITSSPEKINVRQRLLLSSLFGITGVLNSLILFFIMTSILHLPWGMVETIFFLKLTISGHMLIYVAHTKDRWYKFFPSKEVIFATTITQVIASLLAFTGIFMPSGISLGWIVIVWIWAFFWMQVSEGAKILQQKLAGRDI